MMTILRLPHCQRGDYILYWCFVEILQVLPIATKDAVFSLYPIRPRFRAPLNDSCFLSLIALFVPHSIALFER